MKLACPQVAMAVAFLKRCQKFLKKINDIFDRICQNKNIQNG